MHPSLDTGLRLLLPLVEAHSDPFAAMNLANTVQKNYRDAFDSLYYKLPRTRHNAVNPAFVGVVTEWLDEHGELARYRVADLADRLAALAGVETVRA